MANHARGEADLKIGDRTYTVRGSMSAIAEICDALEISSLPQFGQRLMEFRPRDMVPMAVALLKANGHAVEAADIDRDMDWAVFVRVVMRLFFEDKESKPAEGDAPARPPRRQKAAA